MAERFEQADSRSCRARCVLLVPPESSISGADIAELERVLERRSVSTRRCEDSYHAMAELVMLARERGMASRGEPTVVVVVEPERSSSADELYDAAVRYAPHVVFWEYQGGASPRLSAYRGKPRTSAAPIAPPAVNAPSASSPPLRLAQDAEESLPDAAPSAEHVSGADRPAAVTRRPSLTDEELSMLLGSDGPRPGNER